MLLNIFFDEMNSSLELFLIGLFIFAVYWFVLRKHNSLGLRMLFLCCFLFAGCCTWLYKDERNLKNIISKGEEYVATILNKKIAGKKHDNEVTVSFTAKDGSMILTSSSEYVSKEEWEKFESGKPLSVIYIPHTKQTFVQQSIMRFKADKIYLYYFSAFWLVLGLVLYFCLKKYAVKVDDKGNEWLEKADGTVLLDERRSAAWRAAKRGNILSKLVQAFGK